MKKKFLFFVLFFALFSSLFMLSSCAKENKNFEGLGFEDKSVMYDGQAHSLEVTGVPDFAKVSYTANSFTEVGVYEVTATVTAEGYNDWVKKANLSILEREDEVSVEGFEFDWKEVGKEYKITGYNGNATELIIPSSFNGLPVTEIGEEAFYNSSFKFHFTSLTISEGIERIGKMAFGLCEEITNMEIPKSVIYIGSAAFGSCNPMQVNITDISAWCNIECDGIFASPLSNGGRLCFKGQPLSGKIVLSQGIKRVAPYAFYNCADVTEIVIPEGVESIGEAAFYGCTSLTDISVPDSLNYTEVGAFDENSKLNLNLYGNAYYLGNKNNPYVILLKPVNNQISSCEIHENTKVIYNLSGCNSLESLTIPNKVQTICSSAFALCFNLKSISIPQSVESVGKNVFNGCNNLDSVYIDNLSAWMKIDFSYDSSNPLYYADKLFVDNELLSDLTVPSDINEIKNYTFNYYAGLVSVTISENVSSIGSFAFFGCKNLENVTVSGGVKHIGVRAFAECSKLNVLNLDEGIEKIDDSAFLSCTSLTSIIIPNSVKNLGSVAFASCTRLVELKLPDNLTAIPSGLFNGCTSLERVDIPKTVKNIGDSAFYRCYNLVQIVIPDGVDAINGMTFNECRNLKSIVIPSSVKSIVQLAFVSCENLSQIFYCGSLNEFENIDINNVSYIPLEAVHFYSETEPPLNEDGTAYDGQYWRYVDGVPTAWVK